MNLLTEASSRNVAAITNCILERFFLLVAFNQNKDLSECNFASIQLLIYIKTC